MFERDALQQGPVNVAQEVRSRKSHEASAGLRVPIGRHHRAPVRHRQQAMAADGNAGGFGFQSFINATVFFGRLADLADEPIYEKGPGPQAGLVIVALARTAPHGAPRGARPVFGGVSARDHGGSEIQIGPPRGECVYSQTGGLAVTAAGDDRRTRSEPGFSRRRFVDHANDASRRGQFRQLLRSEPQRLQYLRRPNLLFHVKQTQRVRTCPARPEGAHQVSMYVGEHGGGPEEFRFPSQHPRNPVGHGRHIRRLAGDSMNPVAAHLAGQPWHFLPAALVEPHDGGPHRVAFWPQRHKGFALVGDRQGGNTLGSHLL